MYLVVLANRMLINVNYALCDTKVKMSRSTTEYTFLSIPTVDGASKSISETPPGDVEDFLIFRMFQIRTKSFSCACMTGIKLNIRASQWNWDPGLKVFYFIKLGKKSMHQKRLKFLIHDQNAFIPWLLVDAVYKKLLLFLVKNTWSSSQ